MTLKLHFIASKIPSLGKPLLSWRRANKNINKEILRWYWVDFLSYTNYLINSLDFTSFGGSTFYCNIGIEKNLESKCFNLHSCLYNFEKCHFIRCKKINERKKCSYFYFWWKVSFTIFTKKHKLKQGKLISWSFIEELMEKSLQKLQSISTYHPHPNWYF
jgi:hypothetical protein